MQLSYILLITAGCYATEPGMKIKSRGLIEGYFEYIKVVPGLEFANRQAEYFALSFGTRANPTPLDRIEMMGHQISNAIHQAWEKGMNELSIYEIGDILYYFSQNRPALETDLVELSIVLYHKTSGMIDLLGIPDYLEDWERQQGLHHFQLLIPRTRGVKVFYEYERVEGLLRTMDSIKVSEENLIHTIGVVDSDIIMRVLIDPRRPGPHSLEYFERMEHLSHVVSDTIVGSWIEFANRPEIAYARFFSDRTKRQAVLYAMSMGSHMVENWIDIYCRMIEGEDSNYLNGLMVSVIQHIMEIVDGSSQITTDEIEDIPDLKIGERLRKGKDEASFDDIKTLLESYLENVASSRNDQASTRIVYQGRKVLTYINFLRLALIPEYKEEDDFISNVFMEMIAQHGEIAERQLVNIAKEILTNPNKFRNLFGRTVTIPMMIRTNLGINIFARAPGLLDNIPTELLSATRRDSLMRGHLVVYLLIASSQSAFVPPFMTSIHDEPSSHLLTILQTLSDAQFQEIEIALRKLAQMIRWYWRRQPTLSVRFPFPVTSCMPKCDKVVMYMKNIPDIESSIVFREIVHQTGLGMIPTDIINYGIEPFLHGPIIPSLIMDVLNDLEPMRVPLIRIQSQFPRSMGPPFFDSFPKEAYHFWELLSERSWGKKIEQQVILIIKVFIELIQIRDMMMFDPEIDGVGNDVADQCYLKFYRLISSFYLQSNVVSNLERYMTYIESGSRDDDIISVIKGVIKATVDRVQYDGPRCRIAM